MKPTSAHLLSCDPALRPVAAKVLDGVRISAEDALALYHKASLGFLGSLANQVRERLNGDLAYYNRNVHLEPTNICEHRCRFCSYSRKMGEAGAWEYSLGELVHMAQEQVTKGITEIHIVGGVHPRRDVHYYAQMLVALRKACPGIHLKAFSAVELDAMFRKASLSIAEGLRLLQEAGLDSIPGGGAEIFADNIRSQICPEKTNAARWLEIHRTAHQMGIGSNATMLYGHIELIPDRIDHMQRLRDLQDETRGFNAFIPLKYRSANNPMSATGEVSPVEDLRNYALCRIFLDNIPHIKAYWPMIGKQMAQLALWFGADDLDGTIEDSTRIYSLAGAEDQSPAATVEELSLMIRSSGRIPVERNSLYQPV
jgi:aminodeoxyfutalosine synthase